MNRKLRNFFFGPKGSSYTKFSKQNEPTEARFKELFESQAFIAEVNDTAKTSEQGLIKLQTDTESKDRTAPVTGDFAKAVQAHQLPEMITTLVAGDVNDGAAITGRGITIQPVTRTPAGGSIFRRVWQFINSLIFTSSDGSICITEAVPGTIDFSVKIVSSDATVTVTQTGCSWDLSTKPGVGPAGENVIFIKAVENLVVRCDSTGTPLAALPTYLISMSDGQTQIDLTGINLADPTVFNPVVTNCTATYSHSGQDILVTMATLTADTAKIVLQIKYLANWYSATTNISKLYAGASGTQWVYKGELTAAPVGPSDYWWYKNPNTLISYFYEGGAWKILLEGRDDGPTAYTTLTNAGLNVALTNLDRQDQIIHVPAGIVLAGPITITTAGTFSDGFKFNVTFDGGFDSAGQNVDVFGYSFNKSQCAGGNVQTQMVYSLTDTSWKSLVIDPSTVPILPVISSFTRAQANAAIAANTLEVGGFYEITNVHPTLYDDGTTSGTSIMLQAVDTNKFSCKGIGKFWNPKYNQAVSGFGIWSNRSSWTATLTGLVFNANEAITADNGATGTLVGVLADNLFIATAGNWAAATSITGDVTGATATLAGITLKSYVIGQKVIWGHYAWENVNGNVGAATDVLTLDAEWLKLPYTSTDYNLAYDEIEYDYTNNWITSRYESEADNRVTETYATFGDLGYTYHSIAVFQWGNHYNYSSSKGIGGNNVDEGYAEFCNFQGAYFINNIIEQKSYIKDNLFINFSYLYSNALKSGSYITLNTLNLSRIISNELIHSTSYVSLNTLSGSSYISSHILHTSYISNNTLFASYIISNTLNGLSHINHNVLTTSNISYNSLDSQSHISYNTLSVSSVTHNHIDYSYISYNTLSASSRISYNAINENSFISQNTLGASNIIYNTLNSNSDIYSNTLSSNAFQYIVVEKAVVTIGATEEAVFFPIFAAAYTKNIISTVDDKNVLITWDATGVSTPLDLATGIAPV